MLPVSVKPSPCQRLPHNLATAKQSGRLAADTPNSGAYQEGQEAPEHQVQGPVPSIPLHPRLEGLRQGRETQAELTAKYVVSALTPAIATLDLL